MAYWTLQRHFQLLHALTKRYPLETPAAIFAYMSQDVLNFAGLEPEDVKHIDVEAMTGDVLDELNRCEYIREEIIDFIERAVVKWMEKDEERRAPKINGSPVIIVEAEESGDNEYNLGHEPGDVPTTGSGYEDDANAYASAYGPDGY